MNFSNGVAALLTLLGISLFDSATASLNCTFATGFCDWKQTAKQCSWKQSSMCNNQTGCIAVSNNNGDDCSIVGLTANIGSRGTRGIYFEYILINSGVHLLVKDSQGKTLWSYSQSKGPPSNIWQPVLIPINGYRKAVTLEAQFVPSSGGLVVVGSVREVENINDVTGYTPDYPAADTPTSLAANMPLSQSVRMSSTPAAKMPTSHAVKISSSPAAKMPTSHAVKISSSPAAKMPSSHAVKMSLSPAAKMPTSHAANTPRSTLSTMKDSVDVTTTSSSLKTTSSPIVKTEAQTVTTTIKASKTTSHRLTQAISEWNPSTKTHRATTTGGRDNSISSKRPTFEEPVDARQKISTPSIAVLLVGTICSVILLVFLAIFTMRVIRRESPPQ